MSGLYNKKNLAEVKLNLKDALQKLYAPGIQEDLRLFAFSNSLYSEIRSATVKTDSNTGGQVEIPNEIYGLINEPFTDDNGNAINRTKFVTNNLTFSSNNRVFFNTIETSGFTFDRRTSFTDGATVVVSRNGSVVNVEVVGAGSQYQIINSSGGVVTLPASIQVNVRGKESGAENAIVEITILANGTVSKTNPPSVIFGGTGYFEDEDLEVITQCGVNRFGQQETPALHKCKNYAASGNRLYHKSFKYTIPPLGQEIDYGTATLGYTATLSQSKYIYRTKDAGEEGFFLFDEKTNKWVYLGDFYDQVFEIESRTSPLITLRRYDIITSLNLLNLQSLDSSSFFFSYDEGFSVANNLGSQIRSLSQNVESTKNSFKYLVQNNKRQRLVTDEKNTLGTQYNIFEGRNFDSTFRLIMRDPDGIIDKDNVGFTDLRTLEQPDQVELTVSNPSATYHAPGVYINVGGIYKRAFSTDDKPFLSARGKSFVSPLIDKLTVSTDPYTTGSFTPRAESGENKYSISTAYLKPNGEVLVGFDTNIGSLVQNLSSVPGNGGFVYRRVLPIYNINLSKGIQGWPLFDYVHQGTIHSPVILGYV
jgi:hypothetical protein